MQGLAEKYQDFRADHALALLSLRGDMGRTQFKQVTNRVFLAGVPKKISMFEIEIQKFDFDANPQISFSVNRLMTYFFFG